MPLVGDFIHSVDVQLHRDLPSDASPHVSAKTKRRFSLGLWSMGLNCGRGGQAPAPLNAEFVGRKEGLRIASHRGSVFSLQSGVIQTRAASRTYAEETKNAAMRECHYGGQ